MTWCWQVVDSEGNDLFYRKGYLFSALYRFFRSGYWGNGLYISPNKSTIPREFKELFLCLPIDLQQNITDRIWNEGKGYNTVIVRNNHPVIPLSLKFLFSLYGRNKQESPLVKSLGLGAWNGGKISKSEYQFEYGKSDPSARSLVPDFIDRNPLYSTTVDFKMLCL